MYYVLLRKSPTKIRQINRERNYISKSHEKPQYTPSNDQHTSSVDEQHSSNIFLNPYNSWDMSPAAFLSLNRTNDTYSMFNQYPQLTNQQPRTDSYPVFSSLRTMGSKGRDCASALHSFKEITYRTDEWTKKLVRWKNWVISGSPEQWMELHCLWWTVIVSKCCYFFHLFDFYIVCWCNFCCFFENLPFLFPFFDEFEWAVKVHRHFLCMVTLLYVIEAATCLSTMQKLTLAKHIGAHTPQTPLSITYFNTWSGRFSAWS